MLYQMMYSESLGVKHDHVAVVAAWW